MDFDYILLTKLHFFRNLLQKVLNYTFCNARLWIKNLIFVPKTGVMKLLKIHFVIDF